MEAHSEKNAKYNCVDCTPSVFARTNLIHLQKIGTQRLLKSDTGQFDICSSYSFFIITFGSGGLEYDDKQYNLTAGCCGFLDCRKLCTYFASDEGLTIKFLYFYGPNMTAVYDKYLEEGGLSCFCTENLKEYTQIFMQIHKKSSIQSTTADMYIYGKLTSLLTLLMKDCEGTEKRVCKVSQKQDIQKVKDYLDQNYCEKITLDGLAEKFFINKFYLARLFKEQFGFSINSYLIQVRMSHARHLLRFTDMSIEKIGQSCGISDANYFARLFKKMEGMSPGEYRLSKNK